MDRVAVFVDAGYLFAAGGHAMTGLKLQRKRMTVHVARAITYLEAMAKGVTKLPILRVYWYDGSRTSEPEEQHRELAYAPNVKLRLGRINNSGVQKGVDTMMVRDLITLAKNHAVADVILITGDEDILPGILEAQEYGVRIHVVTIATLESTLSPMIRREADTCTEIRAKDIESFLSVVSSQVPYDSAAE